MTFIIMQQLPMPPDIMVAQVLQHAACTCLRPQVIFMPPVPFSSSWCQRGTMICWHPAVLPVVFGIAPIHPRSAHAAIHIPDRFHHHRASSVRHSLI